MASAIERQLKNIESKLDRIAAYERYMPIEKFCEKYGYTRRGIDHLREKYPQIWQGIGGDKVMRNGRTIWRNIRIDLDAYNALFKSPIKL